MQTQGQQQKNVFINEVLAALHLSTNQFMYNLVHYHHYEVILYAWMTKLYKKGKSSDEAIQLIYKARNLFMLNYYKTTCKAFQK
ncbi:hypothetical protein [Aquimarina algicola]|uniref:Uncharacterized protein n=1 Tax=Aquimarina algicola TaxID=2589995 RepID=A0A504JFA1_9FLAO|nr:hypothetical protein [Aquimarina algicola]TPN87392.1 hypothetical protein FHK87_07350 [Aquimarina algicola]